MSVRNSGTWSSGKQGLYIIPQRKSKQAYDKVARRIHNRVATDEHDTKTLT